MEFSGFKTVDSLPTLYHGEIDALVVSDLHLGLEASMTRMGSYVPEFQLDQLKEELVEAKNETGASRLIVNGDLKNEYRTSWSERDEVEEFLEFAKDEFSEVVLVKGNHDTMIEDVIEESGLELVDYHLEEDILFVHGHEELPEEEYDTIVIGHEHPALALKDDVGVKEKVDCFLYGEIDGKNIVVMPAYAHVSEGTRVNQVPRRELLSPVLREHGVKHLKAVAVSREAGLFKFPELEKI